mgnify:CR=1 FL=1
MTLNASYTLTAGVADYLTEHIDSVLPGIKYVGIGTDYEKKGRPQPFILVSPSRIDFNRDVYLGSLESELMIDCLISVDGYEADQVLKQSMLYADALVGLITSDDQLSGLCEHAETSHAEFYPGGSGNRHYAIVTMKVSKLTDT